MIFLSQHVDKWLGDEKSKNPEILVLAIMFLVLYFLTATQDIAVDGWAIALLKKRNVCYTATCNSVGQVVGFTISYAVLLVFESKDFCNQFIFKEERDVGLISFAEFLQFCGIAFIVVTIFVGIFKKENIDLQKELEDHPDYGVKKAYPILWKIVKLKPVVKLSILIISVKICVAACDGITDLKLTEYKIPKDKIAIVSIGKTFARIFGPIFVAKWTTGKFPMNVYKHGFPFRMLMVVVMTTFIYYTPAMVNNGVSTSYYLSLLVLLFLYEVSDLIFLLLIREYFFLNINRSHSQSQPSLKCLSTQR
jgi:MFS transporter, PAT family, solute carrier family 33 (acetyl-CoA transportor), member 1